MRVYIAWAIMILCVGIAFATSTLGWLRFGALGVLAAFVYFMYTRSNFSEKVKEQTEQAKEDFENVKEHVGEFVEDVKETIEEVKEKLDK